jgi:hypothetical protein
MVLENVSHHPRREGVEVSPVVPGYLSLVQQAHVDFVDQRRWLQCMVLALAAHVALGNAMQLSVNERNEILQDIWITLSPSLQQLRYFAVPIRHEPPFSRLRYREYND